MLIGKKCVVGNRTNRKVPEYKEYIAVIACEPQIVEGGDFYVVVLFENRLIRVDTDYIFDIEE